MLISEPSKLHICVIFGIVKVSTILDLVVPMSGETNLRAGILNYVIFSNRFPPPSKLFASSTPALRRFMLPPE